MTIRFVAEDKAEEVIEPNVNVIVWPLKLKKDALESFKVPAVPTVTPEGRFTDKLLDT